MNQKTGSFFLTTIFSVTTLCTAMVQADVIGYWRMEQDDDATGGVSVTNSAGFNKPLVCAAGSLDSGSSDSVMTNRLANAVTNNASLAGGVNIYGNVSSYTNLNSDSITIEFFARSAENDAGFVTRATDSDGTTFGTNGVSIVDPNDLDIFYAIDDGAGGTTNVAWNSLHNSAGAWNHYAFTYDAASGIGAFYLNGYLKAMKDGPNNRALDWGDGNSAIRVGYGMDGGGPLIGQGIFDELRISNTALAPDELLYQPLIARDSFTISDYDYSYINDAIYPFGSDDSFANRSAIVGTVGFSTNKLWLGSQTGNMSIRNEHNLSHSLLAGNESQGALRCKAKDDRTQYRQISTTIPDQPVYYMCVVMRAQTNEPNESISLGFSNSANNRSKGIHVGFNDGKLAVFAGDNAYNISNNPYDYDVNYLAVLRLTANKTGDDVIDVYLAENDAETIDFEETITVETYSSTADISYLKTHIVGHNNDAYQNQQWRFDEVRLGTNPDALGIDSSLLNIPAPEGTVILIQ